ncbi:HTH domain-containing protein [Bacillus wiedmannii]|uniref:HTH domain-containing protein n=1 Tax=Bacillus wiedmannii TaxID=1890302 RepID=A0A4U2N7G6_9BACI|nr:helix-turn-helix domain-containing protein [Bacillus wiedmannii]TKH18978.1 HTH domain-containing protein [Bacillus wiedmannii]
MLISRQKKLIHILIQDNRWYTLSELAYTLECVNTTIRRDLDYLKEFLPLNWDIESAKGKGIRLLKPIEDGIDEFEAMFEQHNMVFQILDQIFHQSVSTIKDLTNNLFIPSSSLYKYLEEVQNYLSYFDLKLDKNPLRIQGTESHIIFMFTELYLKTYPSRIWPFLNFSQEEILNYIKEIENELQITFYPIDTRKISYFLVVLLYRKQQGHQIFIHPTHAAVVPETDFYQKISSLSVSFQGEKLKKIDKIIITIIINCSKYLYKDMKQYRENIILNFQKGEQVVFKYAKAFIYMLEESCKLNLLQNEEFIFQIIQHLKRTIYKYDLIPNIEPPLENEMATVKQKHFQTFQQVKHVYWNWVKKYHIASFVWERDIIIITLQIEALRLKDQSPSKTVLLYTEDDFTWRHYIQAILYHRFGTNLQVKSIPMFCIKTFDFTQTHADMIITTTALPKLHIPTIRISKVPTQRELEDIEMLLYEKQKKKY